MAKNSRWIIIFVIIISVIAATSILNLAHETKVIDHIEDAITVDNGDTKINWSQYPTMEATVASLGTITSPGTYHLTGSTKNGQINIQAGKEDPVRLILDNVDIANPTGPAIYCESADNLVIELAGDSSITDGETYNDSYNDDVTGAIYSKSDLTFQGSGSLTLTATHADGIVGKDDIKFSSGTYHITTADDGIRGKDSVYITGGDFVIIAAADAIKTTNDIDQDKGFILIEDGNFNFSAEGKGIKSAKFIIIHGGTYAIDTTDDSIHADGYITISDGTFNLASADDAIHANRELKVDGGDINITKSKEGLEAQVVTINDGKLSIKAFDDGINAGGSTDESTSKNTKNPFEGDEKCTLSINGGELYINASGDGLDSNGWLYFDGGKTIIDGPINNGNGALDSGMGIIMNGGEVIAIGSSGMIETPNKTSSNYNVSVYLSEVKPANTFIKVVNSDGETVLSHTSAKFFSHLALATPAFNLGEVYTLYLDNEIAYIFTISGSTTNVGENANRQSGPGPKT